MVEGDDVGQYQENWKISVAEANVFLPLEPGWWGWGGRKLRRTRERYNTFFSSFFTGLLFLPIRNVFVVDTQASHYQVVRDDRYYAIRYIGTLIGEKRGRGTGRDVSQRGGGGARKKGGKGYTLILRPVPWYNTKFVLIDERGGVA